MVRQASQFARHFRRVGVLTLLAILLLGAGWLIQSEKQERKVVFPSELDICRTPPDGAFAPRGLWVFPTYISFENGSLVRYRCTFCIAHKPIALFLEEDEIVLISDGKP